MKSQVALAIGLSLGAVRLVIVGCLITVARLASHRKPKVRESKSCQGTNFNLYASPTACYDSASPFAYAYSASPATYAYSASPDNVFLSVPGLGAPRGYPEVPKFDSAIVNCHGNRSHHSATLSEPNDGKPPQYVSLRNIERNPSAGLDEQHSSGSNSPPAGSPHPSDPVTDVSSPKSTNTSEILDRTLWRARRILHQSHSPDAHMRDKEHSKGACELLNRTSRQPYSVAVLDHPENDLTKEPESSDQSPSPQSPTSTNRCSQCGDTFSKRGELTFVKFPYNPVLSIANMSQKT